MYEAPVHVVNITNSCGSLSITIFLMWGRIVAESWLEASKQTHYLSFPILKGKKLIFLIK